MSNRNKTLVVLSMLAAAFLSSSLIVLAQTLAPYQEKPLSVNLGDFDSSGFHAIKQEKPQGNRFTDPYNFYFRVKESVAQTNPEWGDAANLVAVMIRPLDSNWVYNNDNYTTTNLAGRTQVTFTRPGYYIVITGPDQQKVTSLADTLRTK